MADEPTTIEPPQYEYFVRLMPDYVYEVTDNQGRITGISLDYVKYSDYLKEYFSVIYFSLNR